MMFGWFKRRRRRALLSQPFPQEWEDILESDVSHWHRLDLREQSLLRDLVQVFVAEKHWEGRDGLRVDDRMRVTIAAGACLLLLGRPEDLHFDHVKSIIVAPGMYEASHVRTEAGGIVTESLETRLGEAWYRGPVLLSWEDALSGMQGRERGFNVVLHEFAHQLDMLNGGLVDGTPPLQSRSLEQRWIRICQREFEALQDRCRRRQPGVLDCYGGSSPAEFFAVATEAFFERPFAMRTHHEDLYDLFATFYGQDPAARIDGR